MRRPGPGASVGPGSLRYSKAGHGEAHRGRPLAPLRLEAFALSSRAREVATLVAQGLDTAAIAERLFISPWTVQDHCKAIFEKTGTRTRRELRSQISFHDHLPAIAVQTPLDSGGHLEDVGDAPT